MLGNSTEKYSLTTLNLRERPSTQSKILAVIPAFTKIQMLEADDEWLKAQYQGKIGYVSKDYISITKYATSNVNLRKDPSIISPSLAIISKYSKVEVIQNKEGWSKVFYDDKEGYVYSTYLSDDGHKPNQEELNQFYQNISDYVNRNQLKSSSQFLLVTDLKSKRTYVFQRENEAWKLLYQWECTVGKPSTPTITGTFYINGRKPGFGTDKYEVKFATRIKDGYYYHSVLYDPTGSHIIDGRLGEALSHGCIRLETANAHWIYRNIPDGTTVIIH